jgi:hypothetical protein
MKAYEFLKTHDWAQGHPAYINHIPTEITDPNANRFCAVGVLYKVYPNGSEFWESFNKIIKAAMEQGWKSNFCLSLYNDLSSTTKQDILNLFQKANV